MSTAVIILNWNGAEMLKRFLPSVVAHTPAQQAFVVVADNGSTDNSVQVVQQLFPQVQLLQLGENLGFAEGYNRAISQTRADYVVLLNSDVEVSEGWLTPMLQHMESHPNTAACQPKILSFNQKHLFEYAGASGGFIDALGYPYCRGRLLEVCEADEAQYDTPRPVTWNSGAAMLVRRALYIRHGGLDRRFFAHQEEIDLCWRFNARGLQTWCIPQSVVYHVGGGTLQKEHPKKTFLNFRNNLLMLYKNLPTRQLYKVMTLRFLLDMLAALVFLISGKRHNAWVVLKAQGAFLKMKNSYKNERQTNLRLACKEVTLHPQSLLWNFYVKGIKTFDKLPKNKT